MGDLKQIRRLATSAEFVYADGPGSGPGHSRIRVAELKDGGEFGLHPLADGDPTTGRVRVLLPAAAGSGYGLELEGDAETFGRLGRAFLGLQRKAEGQDGGGDTE